MRAILARSFGTYAAIHGYAVGMELGRRKMKVNCALKQGAYGSLFGREEKSAPRLLVSEEKRRMRRGYHKKIVCFVKENEGRFVLQLAESLCAVVKIADEQVFGVTGKGRRAVKHESAVLPLLFCIARRQGAKGALLPVTTD